MEGWIKLHRKIIKSELWTCEPFTRAQAWIDLILLANYEPGFFYLRDHKINVERGQVGWSELKLAQRWKWSRTKVRKFIKDLEKEQQVIQQHNRSTSIITIIKYDEYQKKEQLEDNRKTTERQQKNNRKTLTRRIKKNKEEKEYIEIPSEFEKIWSDWNDYRREIRKPYKTTRGENQKIQELVNLSGGDPLLAGKIIQQSIDNEWTGLFPLKNNISKINGNGINKSDYRQVNQYWDREAPSRAIN